MGTGQRTLLSPGTEGIKMRKMFFGSSLFIAMLAIGCAGSPLHQSLLIHENQRLENALYVAHAQVADLKRENNLLRKQQMSDFIDPPKQQSWDEELDFDAPFEMPKVILPERPGTTEIPESMRGSQTLPVWSPIR